MTRPIRSGLLKSSVIAITGMLGAALCAADVGPVPAALRERLHLSQFYVKSCSGEGIPIVSSDKTADAALAEAAFLVERMLEHRPEIAEAIEKAGVRVAIMAHDEFTTDIPEHSDLEPAAYWNQRARGLGATRQRPAISCGEENLLGLRGDPYAAESIFVHEFGHVIHEIGMAGVDPTFDERLKAAYDSALAEGLWKGTYAATNRSEYWAEAVQSWFDTNRENDREHNDINTRDELKQYDPRLASLCAEVLGDGAWRYLRPADRHPPSAHLEGFDLSQAPAFQWPAELMAYRERFRRGTEGLAPADAVTLEARSAESAEVQHSVNGGQPTTLWVHNTSNEAVDLEWIDGAGQAQKYATLRPGDHHENRTFVGHVWRITAESGRQQFFVAEGQHCQMILKPEPAGPPTETR